MAKRRKCKLCKEYSTEFIIVNIAAFCSYDHAIEWAQAVSKRKAEQSRKAKEKEDRDDLRKRKEALKSKSDWMKEAQTVFNKYIRLRDHAEPCISCQRHHQGQYHAGHYRTVGGNPELRFEELNNNKQCSACNNYLSGNLIDYRINLIVKIGQDKVDWLEAPHEPKRYTIEDIKAIKKKYATLARNLEKEIAD